MRARLISLALAATFCVTPALAQVPEVLPYQGYLADQEALPVNGTVQLTFRLYNGSDDVDAIWEETWAGVQVEVGVFAVMLGAQAPFPDGFSDGTIRYLGVEVDDDGEATPRQSIGSVPYALYTNEARYLRGYGPDDFVSVDDLEGLGYVTEAEVTVLIGDAIVNIDAGLDEAAVRAIVDQAIADVNDNGGVDAAAVRAIVDAVLAEQDYLTAEDLEGYITADQLDARGYITAAALEPFATDQDLNDAVDVLDNDINAARAALQADIDDLSAQVAALAAAVQNQGAFILGRSQQTSNGKFAFNGQNGMQAANAMCQASFAAEPTAHFCSPDEVVRAVAASGFDADNAAAFNNVTTWTVAQATNGDRGNASLHSTCQNLLYDSGDVASGTTLAVQIGYTSNGGGGNATGNVVQIAQEVGCGGNHPVLCCR